MTILSRKPAVLIAGLVSMALALTGCSSGESGESGGGGAGGGKEINIGIATAMTGASAVYGDMIVKGAQLAADEINAEGGLSGHTLKVIVEDHATNPDKAVTAVQKLLSVDKVNYILTSFTAPTLALRPLACEREVPMLNGGAIGADLIGKECLYNTVANSVTMYPRLLEYATKQFSAKKVATVFWNDAAGNAINDKVKETCGSLGCEVVAEEPHELGATDLSVQMARVKAANPDLIVIGSYGDDTGYIISAARRIGMKAPIVGNDFTPNALKIAGNEAMEGYVAILDRFDTGLDDPDTKAFDAAYQKKYNEAPTNFAANYYEHVRYILADAVKTAVDQGQDPTETGVLRKAIDKMIADKHEFTSLYGDKMVLNPDGTVDKPVGLYTVGDGKLDRIQET